MDIGQIELVVFTAELWEAAVSVVRPETVNGPVVHFRALTALLVVAVRRWPACGEQQIVELADRTGVEAIDGSAVNLVRIVFASRRRRRYERGVAHKVKGEIDAQ